MKDENFRNLIDTINENMEANDQVNEAGYDPIQLNRGSNDVEHSFNELLDVRRKLENIAMMLDGYGEDHLIVPIMRELDNTLREINRNLGTL